MSSNKKLKTIQIIRVLMEDKSKQKQKDNQILKMERLLSFHSLEGLVYEKRERKQTVNQFTNIYKPNPHQHQKRKPLNIQPTKDKKQIKNQKKVMKRKVSKELKNTNIQKRGSKSKQKKVQRSCQTLRKRGRPKKSIVQEQKSLNPRKKSQQVEQKLEENQEQQSQNQSQEQSGLESVQQSNDNYQSQQVKTNKNIPEKPSKIIKNKPKRLEQKTKKQISQQQSQQKQDVQNKNGTILQNKNDIKVVQKQNQQQAIVKGFRKFNKLNQDLQQIKQQKYEDKDMQQAQQNQPENKNQQVPKAHKITKIHCISELKKNQQISIPEKRQIDYANDKAIQQKSSGKRLLRIRRKHTGYLNQKNIIHAEDQQNQNGKKRKTGLRRTKNQVQKKYVVFEGQSQESEVENYETKKRKVGNDKQYMINRIFRKTQKANLPNVKIEVDLTKFSLQNFAQKFKVFDMIHCSLPLQMLMKLTDFSSLIFKGFVFIWVQKGQIQMGYHWLNRNGFDVIDQIMWVKTNQSMNQVVYDQDTKGQIFPNCRSTCLVGYKCSLNQKTQYCTKISNNIIFAPEKYLSIQKPQEIFQIGDLMMPGARKLQLGSKQLGGWFTLKHTQKSFARCHYCLRRDFRSLYMTKQMFVICQICQVRKQRMQKLQQINSQQPEQQKQHLVQIKLSDIDISNFYHLEYVQINFLDSLRMFCHNCKIKKQPQLFQLIEKVQNQSVQPQQNKIWCKDCIHMPSIYCKIKVYNFEQVYFARKQVQCSKCLKQCVYKQYYQCFSCKNAHSLCSKCMMSVQQNKIQNDDDEELKNHDWKLKLLYQTPQFKANCFQCKQQCAIPYWSCEICQNFYWCGKCKHTDIPKNHLHHCHYTRKHHLSLII